MPERVHRFDTLARNLEALASETRLELLHSLRTPQALHAIRVPPSLSRGGESPERALSRQAVARHLEQLREAGLVERRSAEGEGADTYVLNHERLFALVDEMRGLAKLRPFRSDDAVAGATLDRAGQEAEALPPPPRLLLAYGRDDGVAYGLQGPPGAQWRLGRAAGSDVRLDYDPYLSGTHCVLARTATGFEVTDSGSRNGTFVNWNRLPKGGTQPLRSGDLLTVGRSLLVVQA